MLRETVNGHGSDNVLVTGRVLPNCRGRVYSSVYFMALCVTLQCLGRMPPNCKLSHLNHVAISILFRLIHKNYHGWLDHKRRSRVACMDEQSSIRTQKQKIVRVMSIILSLFNHWCTRKSRWYDQQHYQLRIFVHDMRWAIAEVAHELNKVYFAR
jgi:hypothetical protein